MATDTATPDFWGELAESPVRTPVSILREQAALLGRKTNNLLEASVETTTMGSTFYHMFNLVAPGLDNYTYELFRIRHEVDLYPVRVGGQGRELKSEDELRDWLRSELSSEKTKRIIGNLMAQARS